MIITTLPLLLAVLDPAASTLVCPVDETADARVDVVEVRGAWLTDDWESVVIISGFRPKQGAHVACQLHRPEKPPVELRCAEVDGALECAGG